MAKVDDQDEQVGYGTEHQMVVKAAPGTTFKVVQTQVVLAALIVLFDLPTGTAQFYTLLTRHTIPEVRTHVLPDSLLCLDDASVLVTSHLWREPEASRISDSASSKGHLSRHPHSPAARRITGPALRQIEASANGSACGSRQQDE